MQRGERRAGLGENGAHPGHELRAAAQVDLDEQVVLVCEEAVDAADRELGGSRDLLDGRVVKAFAREHRLGRVEDLRAAQLLMLPAPKLGGLGSAIYAVALAASSPSEGAPAVSKRPLSIERTETS